MNGVAPDGRADEQERAAEGGPFPGEERDCSAGRDMSPAAPPHAAALSDVAAEKSIAAALRDARDALGHPRGDLGAGGDARLDEVLDPRTDEARPGADVGPR